MKGHLKEIRPGVFYAWFDLPRGDDRKRRQKRVTIYADGIRKAQRQFASILADAVSGSLTAPSRLTVEKYLNQWLEKRAADRLSPITIQTWSGLAQAYLFPELGSTALEKVSPWQVDRLYTRLLTSGRKRDGSGLAPRTVLHIHRLLSGVMKSAVTLRLIPRNPCDGLGPRNVFHRSATWWARSTRRAFAGSSPPWKAVG